MQKTSERINVRGVVNTIVDLGYLKLLYGATHHLHRAVVPRHVDRQSD